MMDFATETIAAIPAVQKATIALQGLLQNRKAAKASGQPLK